MSLALLGRVLFVAALRSTFRDEPRAQTLLDVAVAAMAVSVAVEIVQLGLVASAGWLGEAGSSPEAIVALDAAGTVLFGLVLVPIGRRSLRARWRCCSPGASPAGSHGSA